MANFATNTPRRETLHHRSYSLRVGEGLQIGRLDVRLVELFSRRATLEIAGERITPHEGDQITLTGGGRLTLVECTHKGKHRAKIALRLPLAVKVTALPREDRGLATAEEKP